MIGVVYNAVGPRYELKMLAIPKGEICYIVVADIKEGYPRFATGTCDPSVDFSALNYKATLEQIANIDIPIKECLSIEEFFLEFGEKPWCDIGDYKFSINPQKPEVGYIKIK